MKRIKTWSERCEEHPDHQERIISERMIQARMQEEIDELRQALETEQEPVAWMHNFITNNVITHIPADIGRHPERWTPLYTAPCQTCQSLAMAVMNDQTYHEKVIPKREWVGLTDQEIHEIDGYEEDRKMYRFARTIEAKLKEKNT